MLQLIGSCLPWFRIYDTAYNRPRKYIRKETIFTYKRNTFNLQTKTLYRKLGSSVGGTARPFK